VVIDQSGIACDATVHISPETTVQRVNIPALGVWPTAWHAPGQGLLEMCRSKVPRLDHSWDNAPEFAGL
jgi:hypothetical protein